MSELGSLFCSQLCNGFDHFIHVHDVKEHKKSNDCSVNTRGLSVYCITDLRFVIAQHARLREQLLIENSLCAIASVTVSYLVAGGDTLWTTTNWKLRCFSFWCDGQVICSEFQTVHDKTKSSKITLEDFSAYSQLLTENKQRKKEDNRQTTKATKHPNKQARKQESKQTNNRARTNTRTHAKARE